MQGRITRSKAKKTKQSDEIMPSSPPSSPPKTPPTLPKQQEMESDHVPTITLLSKQIADLQLSFAASERERRKLQAQLSSLSSYAIASTSKTNFSTSTSALATRAAAPDDIITASTAATDISAAVSATPPASATNPNESMSKSYAPPDKITCAPPQVSTCWPGMYNHYNFSTTTAPYPPACGPYLPAHSPPANPPNQMNTQHQIIRKCQDLPEFSGQPEQWPMFIVAFKETTAAHGYTDLENLSRLQKSLRGDAKRTVEALLIHPNSVGAIINTLEFYYGRPEILIRSQLAKVRSFPTIPESKIIEIVNYSIMVSNLTVFLENASASSHLSDPTLLDELVGKLPLNKKEEWARHTLSIAPLYPSIREFNNWLKQIATYIAIATAIPATTSMTNERRPKQVNVVCPVLDEKQNKPKCIVCNRIHLLYQCPTFRNFAIDERWQLAKTNRICFSCLRSGHAVAKCPHRRECGLYACRKYHNRLLHDSSSDKTGTLKAKNLDSTAPATSSVSVPVNNVGTQEFTTNDGPSHKNTNANAIISAIENEDKGTNKRTLFKFLPVRVSGPLGSCIVIAFIDEGAKVSLIEERLANSIGIKGASDILSLRWIADQTTTELSQHVNFEISGVYANAIKYQMRDVRTTKSLLLPAQTLHLSEFKRRYAELGKILIEDYVDAVPQILIGIPHTNLVRPTSILNIDKGFAAHNTKLGWTLFGSNEDSYPDAVVSYIGYEEKVLEELHRQVAEYFAIEGYDARQAKSVISENDKRAEIILKETTKKVNNQYETGLLWKTESVQFCDSYSMALKRLETIERKMSKNPEYAEWYKSKIKEYVDKNYARKLKPEEMDVTNSTWYLPHFSVCNVNKGNKLRLVFDAAAEVEGMSLNSMLLKGPEAYQPKSLVAILFAFRQRKISVCGDIREMFLRVNIRPEDQNSQRFLWRNGDPSRQPDTYVMRSMIFGSRCSPCSAQYIKNLNANKYKNTHPRAVKAIVDCHYVDDYVDSFDTVEEAIEVAKAVKIIHSHAGFEIRNFISNAIDLRQEVNQTTTLTETEPPDLRTLCQSSSTTDKILGMYWDSRADTFCFLFKFCRIPQVVLSGNKRPTKSQVLSITMSIFDPFGLLANVTIMSKLLLQRLWKTNVMWNEEIPEDIYNKWYKWYKQLDSVKDFKVPRCYHSHLTNSDADVQLHIFVDASEVAFAAVGYWRVTFGNDVSVSFIIGKTRCSPLKALSIPRLELQAAVLGVRLKEAIVHGHEVKPNQVILWSDSKTVIHWIRSDSRCYKQFVAHRIAEILEYSDVSDWKWVPGKENPADEATRPQSIPMASTESMWITGPLFLKHPEESWPKLPDDINAHDQQSERRQHLILSINTESPIIPFQNFSSYYRLLRAVCEVQRAAKKFIRMLGKDESGAKSSNERLSVKEIRDAEILACRLVQQEAYRNEMHLLLSRKSVTKKSAIYKLTPILDENNIIRLGGRLDNAACLPYYTKRPIILPRYHPFSKLLVQHYHEIFQHHNQEAIICAIRAKFWIPSLRRLVRSAKSSCQRCKNLSAAPEPSQMGQLPVDRLTPYVRPFSYTGLDYFGPVEITIGRRREKRWVAIFTCLSVRAIHLEVARDLSSGAVILCLRNFVNRRGVPVRIRSDCGTNFIGTAKEDWIRVGNSMEKECTRRGIEWLFNVPGNPAAGGAWERLVRCVKNVLSFTLKEKAPQLETLQSLLIEAENLVNSRPLTHLPLESNDAEPLTPNHFLLGCPNYVQTPSVDDKTCLRKQWHILQQLKQTFWRRWMLEYLPTLTRRTKWHERVKPMQVGDYVIICDDNESRGEWKRGRVVGVFVVPDGQVRSAAVKTSTGILRRPTTKLAKLDIIGESSTSIHGGRDVTTQN